MRLAIVLALATVLTSADAWAQTNMQLWGNVTINWLHSERLTYELDFEPKVLLAKPDADPAWSNLDVSPNAEYALKRWMDLVMEGTIGYTKQTDDVNSWEVSPRAGVRLYLFSRDLPVAGPRLRELPPTRRLVVRDLVRVESRNFFYTGSGSGSDSSIRFRNRLEMQFPINRPKVTDDGAQYWLTDWEWFIPLSEPGERFASKQRIRLGLGYRRNLQWRFEALYIWTRSRNTIEEGFKTSDNIIDIRLKRVF